MRTLHLRVNRDSYPWLNKAAKEVNFVWNWANQTSYDARRRTCLAVRAWTCQDCGAVHDRNINAAKNILARAEASASVCGNEFHTALRATFGARSL